MTWTAYAAGNFDLICDLLKEGVHGHTHSILERWKLTHLCGGHGVFLGNLDDVGMIEDRPLQVVLFQLPRVTERRVGLKHYTWSGEHEVVSGVLTNELCNSC